MEIIIQVVETWRLHVCSSFIKSWFHLWSITRERLRLRYMHACIYIYIYILYRDKRRSHIVAWGPWPPQKKKKFLLDYEEKINRPPNVTQPAPHSFLTHSSSPQSKIRNTLKLKNNNNYMFYFQAKKKKNPKKKFELKSKKKYIYIYITKLSPRQAKTTVSPLQVARSRQAHRFSTKKKNQKIRNWTHHVASSLAERSNPNIKANQTQRTPANQTQLQQTKHRGVYKKKKKIPNTQTKTKPSNPQTVTSPSSSPQLACRHHRCLPGRPSSQIVDRRSENADRSASAPVLAARCSLRPSLKVFRSFSLWLSLSLSVFI